ncbi:hypothetical protein ACVW0A_000582 [Pseudomonas sp. TE3610]
MSAASACSRTLRLAHCTGTTSACRALALLSSSALARAMGAASIRQATPLRRCSEARIDGQSQVATAASRAWLSSARFFCNSTSMRRRATWSAWVMRRKVWISNASGGTSRFDKTCSNCPRLMGLTNSWSMPASRQRCASSWKALALQPMMGRRALPLAASAWRMPWASAKPLMSGMLQSVMITSRGWACHSASASWPLAAAST